MGDSDVSQRNVTPAEDSLNLKKKYGLIPSAVSARFKHNPPFRPPLAFQGRFKVIIMSIFRYTTSLAKYISIARITSPVLALVMHERKSRRGTEPSVLGELRVPTLSNTSA